MFRALFPFEGTNEGTLTFKQNDLLTIVQPVDKNWYFGCLDDAWGFIPVKYVQEVEDKDCDYMIKSINACIAKLQKIPEKKATKDERSALRKLTKYKDALVAELSSANEKQQKQQQQPPQQQTAQGGRKPPPPPPGVPPRLSRQLVEAVRSSTRGSHQSCVEAVKIVLATLNRHLANQSEELAALIGQLAVQFDSPDTADDLTVMESPDWRALNRLLAKAESRRCDWQERGGWSLHEQAGEVSDEVNQLTELLIDSDAALVRRRLRQDGYSAPLCMAELYSAETRTSVRRALILCLATMCRMDRGVVDALLGSSFLPTDLLRDAGLRDPDADAISLLPHSLQLLAMLFSSGILPPCAVMDELNEKLFGQLFARLADCSDSLAQAIVTFLLAVNLHFGGDSSAPAHELPLFRALLDAPSACHVLTECILPMFNDAEDPAAALLTHSPPLRDSVLKMLIDLFSHPSTEAVFYTTDIPVLQDVVIRQLSNAPLDHAKLPALLQLLENCVRTSRYQDSFYKNSDLRLALRSLSEQDKAPAIREQAKSLSQLLFKGVQT